MGRKRTGLIALVGAALLLVMFVILAALAEGAAAEETKKNHFVDVNKMVETMPEEPEAGTYIIQGPEYGITDEERELIEKVVAAEARGESIECMMAVAQTIRDRCIIREQSPIKVLTAPNQFAAPYEGRIIDRVKDAVSFTFDSGHSVFEYPVTHFYASHLIEPPDWTYNLELAGEIDGVSFYRE